jgi:hypothetical protein
MDTTALAGKFARIGARLKVTDRPARLRWGMPAVALRLDILEDREGEYFEAVPDQARAIEVTVLDVQPDDRHLLLLVREGSEKHKFLCGHDERHWFVAAVPEEAPVGNVRQAKEALKPGPVIDAQARNRLGSRARNLRKNAAYKRQGEWFFLPAPGVRVVEKLVLRHEPLRRGAGKPHWCDHLYRIGGEDVWVTGRYPNGVTPVEYRRILDQEKGADKWPWRAMKRDPRVFVRGRVRHADHRTIVLHGWHQVVMNTETQALAMRDLAFLD